MFRKSGILWGSVRFPLPTLLYAGYNVNIVFFQVVVRKRKASEMEGEKQNKEKEPSPPKNGELNNQK